MRRYLQAKIYSMFFLVLLLAIFVHCNLSQSDGCGLPLPEQPENGFSYRFHVQVDDPLMGTVEREYLLHLPTHYKTSNDVAVPLILDFHGWTSNAGTHCIIIIMMQLIKIENEKMIFSRYLKS